MRNGRFVELTESPRGSIIAPVIFPHPVLVGDIGGTNTRLARVEALGAPPGPIIRIPTNQAAFAEATARAGARALLLGAAGPATGRGVVLTNAAFSIDGPRLLDALDLAQGLVVNDFEAEALGLAALAPDAFTTLAPDAGAGGARLILGPGTGIGVGALVEVGGRLLPLGTEAGHIGFAAESAEEDDILRWLRAREGRVCVESLLCAPGLARLHAARVAMAGGPEQAGDAHAVIAAAQADPRGAAAASLALFWRMLGAFAGDMALVFRATGGVWLTGDFLRAIYPLCRDADFIAAFVNKPPYEDLMRSIGTHLVTRPHMALAGLARLASTPDDYLIDYAARCWRTSA